MEQKRNLTPHLFLRAAIMIGFAMYIIFLVKSNNMQYYIAPRMMIYVKLSAIGFYAIAVYQVYMAIGAFRGTKADCDCVQARSVFGSLIIYSLFILPLVFGFIMPDTALGSSVIDKRGINVHISSIFATRTSEDYLSTLPDSDSSNTVNQTPTDQELKEMFITESSNEDYAAYGMKLFKQDLIEVKQDGYIETLTTLDLFTRNFIGKKMEVSGFVYHMGGMEDNFFALARFFIRCCSADGSALGVVIKSDDAKKYAPDTWLKVTGTISKGFFMEQEIMVLNAEKIEKIEPSNKQYVYPTYTALYK